MPGALHFPDVAIIVIRNDDTDDSNDNYVFHDVCVDTAVRMVNPN
jgi:hypothetical protein